MAVRQPKCEISTQVEADIHRIIKREAQIERRSISNLIRGVIEDWVATRQAPARPRQSQP
jgi:hypothetical protein